jgi:hypothetical protein
MLRKLRRGAQGSPPSTLREDHTERTQVRAAGAPHTRSLWGRNILPLRRLSEQLKEVQIYNLKHSLRCG